MVLTLSWERIEHEEEEGTVGGQGNKMKGWAQISKETGMDGMAGTLSFCWAERLRWKVRMADPERSVHTWQRRFPLR